MAERRAQPAVDAFVQVLASRAPPLPLTPDEEAAI